MFSDRPAVENILVLGILGLSITKPKLDRKLRQADPGSGSRDVKIVAYSFLHK